MNSAVGLLLLCFTVLGDTSADDPLQRVHGFVGLTVVLPCRQYLPKDTEVPTIEWSKPGLKPSPYVLVYRQNYEIPEEKHKDFQFRTHVFTMDVDEGNFSMRLSDVRETDAGRYLCKTIWNKDKQDVKIVELVVGRVPTPELSVVSVGSGVVNLSCEVRVCFLTEARLTFWDGHGNLLKEDKAKPVDEDASGCYTLEQQVTAPTSAKSVVCRADFAEIGQSRDTHMLIPEDTKESCTVPMVYAGIGTGLAILMLVGVGLLIYKCCKKHCGEKRGIVRQSTDETTGSNGSENDQLLSQGSPFVAVKIPEIHQDQRPTLTAEPHLISSTPNSTVSEADSRNGSVRAVFPHATDNDGVATTPATCEINGNSVKFTKKEEETRAKLTRQDACTDVIMRPKSLSNSALNLATGISKSPTRRCPVTRSRSVSDSSYSFVGDLKSPFRRQSLLPKVDADKAQLLEEELEHDGPPPKMDRQE